MKKTILTSLILSLLLSPHSLAGEHAAHAPDTAHAPAAAPVPPAAKSTALSSVEPSAADEALQKLIAGNARFAAGEPTAQHQDQARRCETVAGGQHPYVTILSCADSRVPPEIVFDAGLGDLFVIRIAGNVADTDEIATIEYGVGHLNSPLIVVMGHTKCGAVHRHRGWCSIARQSCQANRQHHPSRQINTRKIPRTQRTWLGRQGNSRKCISVD